MFDHNLTILDYQFYQYLQNPYEDEIKMIFFIFF